MSEFAIVFESHDFTAAIKRLKANMHEGNSTQIAAWLEKTKVENLFDMVLPAGDSNIAVLRPSTLLKEYIAKIEAGNYV